MAKTNLAPAYTRKREAFGPMASTLTAGGSILEEIVRLKDCGDARGYPQAIARLASKYPTLTDQFAILNDLKEIDFPAGADR